MHQLLPEVIKIFDRLQGTNHYEKNYKDEHMDTAWSSFVSLMEKVDKLAENEKKRIVKKIPSYMREKVKDAFSTKKNNDRTLASYLGLICVGGNPKKFMNILIAMDIHDLSVTLIDDIIDKEEKRANEAAHYLKWGINVTLTIAMFLKSLSSQILLNSKIDIKIKLKILKEIEGLHSKIYKGQLLDIEYENKEIDEISNREYLNMVSLTTGSQYAGFLRIGGILGESNSDDINLLGKIGFLLGTLGQIRDDLVDYLSDYKEIWKTPLLDFKNKKRRLPLIIGWRNANSNERKRIIELQENQHFNDRDYIEILRLIMKPDNIEEIKMIMANLKKEGFKLIEDSNFTQEGKKTLKSYFSYGMSEI